MQAKRLTGHVISHTHWDRAWYLPFEIYRLRLVQLTRKLLDLLDRDTRYLFCFDGQTVPIEDYLEVCPEDRARIEKHVRSGRLHVGPFYCLPDHFIISAESIIRNVMIGKKQAQALGRCQSEGALSDIFGHPSQTPQILAGLGIRSAIVARGFTKEQARRGIVHDWIAPDGKTRIPVYLLAAGGYANMYFWGIEHFDPATFPTPPPDGDKWSLAKADEQLSGLVEEYRRQGLNTGHLYIGNGVDHQEAQPQTPEIIRLLNKKGAPVHLVHSTYEAMMNAVRREKSARPAIRGPLGECSLYGTLTSRVYLKQAYASIAGRIEMLLEPLLACADVYGHGWRFFREYGHCGYTLNPGQNWAAFPCYPASQVEHLWKLLLRNAPHDDICGCSVDATHQDMENRFKRAREISEYLLNDAMLVMAGRCAQGLPEKTAALVAFNPHPFPVRERLSASVFLEAMTSAKGLEVVDTQGRAVPSAIDAARIVERHPWEGNDWLKTPVKGLEATLSIAPELPPCSFSVFQIQGNKKTAPCLARPGAAMKGRTAVVENAFYRIVVHPNGTFDLRDKALRRRFAGLGLLEDVEDIGDSYVTKRFEKPCRVTSEKCAGRVRIARHDALSTTVEVSLRLMLPEGLAPQRGARSQNLAACPMLLRYEIPHFRKAVRISIAVGNRAKDHELFMLFPTAVSASRFSYDTKFDLREYEAGERVARIDSAAFIQDGRAAFGLASECPTLLLSRRDKSGVAFGLSILRAVGMVNAAIPADIWPAHEAQCLRRITRTVEITTGAPDEVRNACLMSRRTIIAPPLAIPITPWEKNRYIEREHTTLAVPETPLLKIDGGDVHLSAWKRSEDGAGWIVRVYSLADKPGNCRMNVAVPIESAFICTLDEKPLKRLAARNGGIAFVIGPREIVTLLLRLDRAVLNKHMARRADYAH